MAIPILSELADSIAGALVGKPEGPAMPETPDWQKLPSSDLPLPGEPTEQSLYENNGRQINVKAGQRVNILSVRLPKPEVISVAGTSYGLNAAGDYGPGGGARAVIVWGVRNAIRKTVADCGPGGLTFTIFADSLTIDMIGIVDSSCWVNWALGARPIRENQTSTFTCSEVIAANDTRTWVFAPDAEFPNPAGFNPQKYPPAAVSVQIFSATPVVQGVDITINVNCPGGGTIIHEIASNEKHSEEILLSSNTTSVRILNNDPANGHLFVLIFKLRI